MNHVSPLKASLKSLEATHEVLAIDYPDLLDGPASTVDPEDGPEKAVEKTRCFSVLLGLPKVVTYRNQIVLARVIVILDLLVLKVTYFDLFNLPFL